MSDRPMLRCPHCEYTVAVMPWTYAGAGLPSLQCVECYSSLRKYDPREDR